MTETLKGACLCDGVEYEVQDPEALGYCHCTRCQRWTGEALAGVVVAKENFRFTKGQDLVKTYESHLAPRNFCGNCGSSLYDDLGDVYFVSAGRIVAEGTPDEMRGSREPYVHQFIHGESDGPVPFHYPAAPYRAARARAGH